MVSGAQKKEVLCRVGIIAPAVRAGRRRVQADAVAIAAQQYAMASTQLGHRHRISTRYVDAVW